MDHLEFWIVLLKEGNSALSNEQVAKGLELALSQLKQEQEAFMKEQALTRELEDLKVRM